MVLNEISENQQRYWDSSTGEDEDVHNNFAAIQMTDHLSLP